MIESLKVAEDRPQGWGAWARIAPWGVAALAVAAIAAASSPAAATGKLPGFIAGAIMIALVIYAFIDYLRPLTQDPDAGLLPALLVLAALAVVKLVVMPYFPGFGPDVGDYQAWASQIATFGPAHTYQQGFFLDYPPGYLYGLWVAGIFAHAIGATGDFYRVIIQSPAIVADFALAILMYAFMRRGGRPEMAFIAMLMVALNPALLFDTVVWGQSDSVMTFVTLLSIVAILGDQYEIAWGLAAIAVLVKPQGLMMLPVLGVLDDARDRLCDVDQVGPRADPRRDHRHRAVPNRPRVELDYQALHFDRGLLSRDFGQRIQPDGAARRTAAGRTRTRWLGVSYFALGMSLLVPLYAFVAWILWRGRTPTRLLFASFIAVFGFFMVAPRMHERYMYPAIALAVPLALEAPEMLAVFVIHHDHLLHQPRLHSAHAQHRRVPGLARRACDDRPRRSTWSRSGWPFTGDRRGCRTRALRPTRSVSSSGNSRCRRQIRGLRRRAGVRAAVDRDSTRSLFRCLLIAAAVTRFWHLGHPAEIVFDEVHFVAQGRHYLHGESFLDPHPPLAKLVIALGILIFGDHPFGWRVGNATIGTALVGITYLLGRRLTGSRLVGALAGAILLCDGMYLVDSHYAVIDIVYLTCAAVAYLLLFKFAETVDAQARRRILPWIGLALGLCLASKLYIPAITFLLVMGFLVYVIARDRPKPAPPPPQVEVEAARPIPRSKKIKAPAPVADRNQPLRSDLDALHCPHLYCARTACCS